jgi:predicted MarR family transcription regulator
VLDVKTEDYAYIRVYDAYKKSIFNTIKKGGNADRLIRRYKQLRNKGLLEEIDNIVMEAEKLNAE